MNDKNSDNTATFVILVVGNLIFKAEKETRLLVDHFVCEHHRINAMGLQLMVVVENADHLPPFVLELDDQTIVEPTGHDLKMAAISK